MNIIWNTYWEVRKWHFNFDVITRGKKTLPDCQSIFCFDIETSNGYVKNGVVEPFDYNKAEVKDSVNSFYYDTATPVSLMYVWQCAVEHDNTIDVVMGRTYDEFKQFLLELTDTITLQAYKWNTTSLVEPMRTNVLNKCRKHGHVGMHIYIHNLGFEFQHLRNLFEAEFSRSDKAVFARSPRKPMKVSFGFNYTNLTFHDTLSLTQKSLDNWCKDANLPVKKLTGTFNYNIIRTPNTELTPTEIDYCVNDVVSMVYGVQQYRNKYITLANIPMTQTGEVRRTCIDKIARVDGNWSKLCTQVTNAMGFNEYARLSQCFLGGWTHANAFYTDRLLHNLRCFDFRSSYPGVMVSRKFPVTSFQPCTEADIKAYEQKDINDRDYLYYVLVEFKNVVSNKFNTFWSTSKCVEIRNVVADNGRVKECDYLKCYMTDLDFDTFRKVYDYDECNILEAYSSKASYLPTAFINVILEYYKGKTALKGTGRTSEYNESKQFINSLYGVCVTKIITDNVTFHNGWEKTEATMLDFIETVTNMLKKEQFYTYQIGVWVTAWARHNLWDAIQHLDFKTVYCDTDSIKGLFDDNDLKWFDDYNKGVWDQCMKCAKARGINPDLYRPKTPKGVTKEIGWFDREHDCIEFKTLGAKRYVDLVWDKDLQQNVVETTIAGLPKSSGTQLIHSVDDFNADLKWNCKISKKLISCYNENQPMLDWVDYNGDKYTSIDRYGLNLMPTSFELGVSDDYRLLYELLQGYDNDMFDTPKIIRVINNQWLTNNPDML